MVGKRMPRNVQVKSLSFCPADEVRLPIGSPRSSELSVVPFFIPFAGCPHRCLFCAQTRQTGHKASEDFRRLFKELATLGKQLAERKRTGKSPVELAFYGGTFTALPETFQMDCLALARKWREEGFIGGVRCSTRPDAVPPLLLARLHAAGLDRIELGIQSFHDAALIASGRGYDGKVAHEGCRRVLEAGFRLGLQLLPGMPGSTPDTFLADVREALSLRPDCLRLYPCLVIRGTPLAGLWETGRYTPWDQKRTVDTLGLALAACWSEQTPVIRLSLAPEPALEAAVLAGPRHPALGSLIQGEALCRTVENAWQRRGCPPNEISLPAFCRGFFAGHKGALLPRWRDMGIIPRKIRWVSGYEGLLRWNRQEMPDRFLVRRKTEITAV